MIKGQHEENRNRIRNSRPGKTEWLWLVGQMGPYRGMILAVAALGLVSTVMKVLSSVASKYVIDALDKGWAVGWRARGWKKADKKPALNPDLWETLLNLCETHKVNLHWVKGHAENPYNNRCDELAVSQWQKLK